MIGDPVFEIGSAPTGRVPVGERRFVEVRFASPSFNPTIFGEVTIPSNDRDEPMKRCSFVVGTLRPIRPAVPCDPATDPRCIPTLALAALVLGFAAVGAFVLTRR